MLKIYIILILVIASSLIFGENSDGFKPDTILDSKALSIGGYGGVVSQGMYMNNQFYYASGGEGGIIINHQFIIGGGGRGIALPVYTTNNSRLFMGWGGLMLGYIFAPESVVHPYIKTLIGAGGVGEVSKVQNYYPHDRYINAVPFFSLDGELGAQFNIIKWIRASVFGGYHYIYGPVYFSGITDSNLYSIDFGVKFEFGRF